MPNPKTSERQGNQSRTGPHLTQQINVRWCPADVNSIDEIANREMHDRSEVVRFLVQWALPYYQVFGSILEMRKLHNNLVHGVSRREPFINLDEEVTRERAEQRLNLRNEAKDKIDQMLGTVGQGGEQHGAGNKQRRKVGT